MLIDELDKTKRYMKVEEVFIKSWIEGVRIIGEAWFTHNPNYCSPATCIDQVNNKWQVIPNYQKVNGGIVVLSTGEAALLAAMCSVYNPDWGGKLLTRLGIMGLADLSSRLDSHGRRIICDLILYYRGW